MTPCTKELSPRRAGVRAMQIVHGLPPVLSPTGCPISSSYPLVPVIFKVRKDLGYPSYHRAKMPNHAASSRTPARLGHPATATLRSAELFDRRDVILFEQFCQGVQHRSQLLRFHRIQNCLGIPGRVLIRSMARSFASCRDSADRLRPRAERGCRLSSRNWTRSSTYADARHWSSH